MNIPVVQTILSANDQIAAENRAAFTESQVFVVNLMASPGAGKTSFILATIAKLRPDIRAGVIEGDIASRIDADTIAQQGVPVVQINTGGSCHLDAPMVRNALPHLTLNEIDLLFIENVGNLICPVGFDLGANIAVALPSVAEGHDKPYKYPGIFANANAIILNKSDLIDIFEFDQAYFQQGIAMVNTHAPLFPISCRSEEGLDQWIAWIEQQIDTHRQSNNMVK